VIQNEDVPDEDPDLDATAQRREQPLFGGAAAASDKIRTAALGTGNSGAVWLDVGRVSGVGVGSEFVATLPNSDGQKVQLRVTALQGIARSVAEVVSPQGAKVSAGEVFEMTKWSPAQSAPLHVWHWPATLAQADILAAAAQIQAAGVASVSDPAAETWTHILSWDGTNWTLQQAGAPAAAPIGATLTAAALKKKIPTGAKLWVNLPPSRELVAQLLPPDPNSAVQTVATLASAEYALTGVLTPSGPAWAWYHKNELAAGPPPPNPNHLTPGCSATSQYPVRSDWVAMPDVSAMEKGAATLNHYAALLAKVHGWLEMANSPADASRGNYYSLALIPYSGGTPLAPGQLLHEGDQLKMALRANGQVTEKRWVYVLDIDCHGQGTVLYPRGNSGNQFPNESDTGNQFLIPGAPALKIGAPFGTDTFVLLSTAQPLSDPFVLNFEGVSRSRGGEQSPLEQLLSNTSSGTRGNPGQVPTNWGIGLTAIHSVPNQASQ
jgi:Domain of unknown function (DUF4384)